MTGGRASARPTKTGTGPICAKHPAGRSGKLDLSPFSLPPVVYVATPSYAGSHAEGFHATVRALVDALSDDGPGEHHVNLMPGIVSPADIRYLRESSVTDTPRLTTTALGKVTIKPELCPLCSPIAQKDGPSQAGQGPAKGLYELRRRGRTYGARL